MNLAKEITPTHGNRRPESAPVEKGRIRVLTLFSRLHKRSHSDCDLRLNLDRLTSSPISASTNNSPTTPPYRSIMSPSSPNSPTTPPSPGARGFMNYLAEEENSLIDESSVQLKNILQDKKGRELLRHFLKKEFAEENLLFYEAVENYSLLPEWDAPAAATLIYKTFIIENAQYEVNLPEIIIDQIRHLFDQSGRILNSYRRVHKEIFEQARAAVFRMMLNDTMSRFCTSPEYKEFCGNE
eukprot:TRINITY_DN12508_c0_g1_i1.p1 TRINITY_DN12508_c0_g1~~TRINITY_DN12508_c0_g1_i1.p1  ORF type:complete len:240 (+),score=49.10 TRINITY_DN12508_c0_g1_i1:37-756(+)